MNNVARASRTCISELLYMEQHVRDGRATDMPKRDPLADALDALARLRREEASAANEAAVREFLNHKSHHVVAMAVQIAREKKYSSLADEIAGNFARFMVHPEKTDQGCTAKTEIAHALLDFGTRADEIFLQGARHVQMEGSWGSPVDSAATLRAHCAMGLVCIGHRKALRELARLFFDSQMIARVGAARAAQASRLPEAALLLRMKAFAGDNEPDVLTEVFTSLLAVERADAVDFVAQFLENPKEEVIESALLALGESRLPEAFGALEEIKNRFIATRLQSTFFTAIALTRQPRAIELLIEQIRDGPDEASEQALRAAAIYRADAKVFAEVEKIVGSIKDPKLSRVFQTEWLP